jgi:hypothetical protein
MKRTATATSVLELAAWAGLFVGVAWWTVFFLALIAPTSLVDLALVLVFATAYAVVLPMLVSLLLPGTPAGMLLAETRWRTLGHALAVAATLFMVYHGFISVWAWWAARPNAVATKQDLFLAIGSIIVFVVVPALSWVQMAPDRWVAEVVQAQQVKRLKAAQQANLMAAQIQYARAMALLKRGLANATAAERAELAGTLIAMQRAENEAINQVADQMRIVTGIDSGVQLLDDDLADVYHGLTHQLDRLIAPVADDHYVEPTGSGTARATGSATSAAQPVARPVAPHSNALEPVEARTDTNTTVTHGDTPYRTVTHGDTNDYRAHERSARAALPDTWTIKQVAAVLTVSESQAREMAAAWCEDGHAAKTGLKGHYTGREQ